MQNKIISIGELNRISRLMIDYKRQMSAWPLMLLLELSKSNDWQPIAQVVRKIDGKASNSNHAHMFKPLIDLGLIEAKKVESSNSQFDAWHCRIKPSFHLIEIESFDGDQVLNLQELALNYLNKNRKTSALLMLVLIAVKIRKLTDTANVKYFCAGSHEGHSSHSNILNGLVDIGAIQLVKTDDYRKAPVIIFEVE